MKLYTTLKRIKEFEPCKDGIDALYRVIGEEYPENKEIYFSDLLKAGVGFKYILLGLRAVPEEQKEYTYHLSVAFACDCMERTSHSCERQYSEVAAAAWDAWDVADWAAWAAAWDAWDAAARAARATAWAARANAWDAGDAAWTAERAWQVERLIEYVDGKVDFMRAEGGDSGDLS